MKTKPMNEREFAATARITKTIPLVILEPELRQWCLVLPESEPSGPSYGLTTARGEIRTFKNVGAAFQLCERMGIPAQFIPSRYVSLPAGWRPSGGRVKK